MFALFVCLFICMLVCFDILQPSLPYCSHVEQFFTKLEREVRNTNKIIDEKEIKTGLMHRTCCKNNVPMPENKTIERPSQAVSKHHRSAKPRTRVIVARCVLVKQFRIKILWCDDNDVTLYM